MNLWQEAVTDRTQTDVDKAVLYNQTGWNSLTDEQKAEWLAGMKGSLNESDLLRIENNIKLLSDVLELSLDTYADGIPELVNESYFANLLSNVQAIRDAGAYHQDTPAVPEKPVNDYQKVNNIEKILDDIYQILLNNFHYYAGSEIYAGDEFGFLL